MNFASVHDLCLQLISLAIQRCRASEQLCRLSAVIKFSPSPDLPLVHISISDTGIGGCLEEFQGLKYSRGGSVDALQWDICDNEIHHYQLNLKESISAKRLTRRPSNLKNGVKFSGSEVYLSVCGSIDFLLEEINCLFQKMLILKLSNLAMELVVDRGDIQGSQNYTFILDTKGSSLQFSASNLDRLKSGLEDYVLKHQYSPQCKSCIPSRESLKVGGGMVSTEKHRATELMVEAVIVINEISKPTSTCFRACGGQTKVLCFKDFAPCSVSPASLKALSTIDWKSYGLTLGEAVDEGLHAVLKWENLPPCTHIDIVLHSYHNQVILPSSVQRSQISWNFIRKAVKLALDDLKDKHTGVLLSDRALKIRSYAPDLARTIAGLIMTSNDSEFQGECFALLGLQSRQAGEEQEEAKNAVEKRIEKKIILAMEINDRKPQGSKEIAPSLFEDNLYQEMEVEEEEYERSEGYI